MRAAGEWVDAVGRISDVELRRGVLSIMYYYQEIQFCALHPWYRPPRLLGEGALEKMTAFARAFPQLAENVPANHHRLLRGLLGFISASNHGEDTAPALKILRDCVFNALDQDELEIVPGLEMALGIPGD